MLETEKETSKLFQSMANTDSMTGVRNKLAYTEYESKLDALMRSGELKDGIAVLVCDINGLKYVNDTQGHAAGDQLIIDACNLICELFSHGAVFRIGGDEFAVFLQGKAYDTREETLASFNSKIEKNIYTNGVVVAIGHSELREDDGRIQDVFERADHMMYQRKSQLKAMGAKVRD